ncbi:amidase [Aspergillus steynii IBT 23096]|uniref:Amidase n=1 Tax=Aspergillus steynii IBT 23096 TaxID=1392250 RepID=A0A2I2FVD0_9EURO|nr:amidase [Aspergillus steynii IBT 23096]PLB44584.1 amidase [Aspergillus steynii IBT 23096]
MELTISDYHDALRSGRTTCAHTVAEYLSRIALYNPTLRALITINPNALHDARQKDREGFPHSPSPLHGVPLILKDTYATSSMPTTSGVCALRALTTFDAPVVQRLLAAGAILLAKANLHEFSLEGVTLSSLGGQALNPYDLTRTPGGSSGGTAAALAANLALAGCGGDTVNSLRSPASACSVVGFRPSRGRVDTRGVMPVSWTQDVAGPMARTVRDVRILFDVMKDGEYLGDPAIVPSVKSSSDPVRIGVLIGYFPDESTSDGLAIIQTITHALHLVGSKTPTVEFLPLQNQPDWDVARLRANADTQAYEFQSALDSFLQSPMVKSTPHLSLASVTASGEYHGEAVTPAFWQTQSQTQHHDEKDEEGGEFTPTSPQYRSRLDTIARLKESVTSCFEDLALDALVFPHQRQLVARVGPMVQPGRNGILAALTGRPAICIPAGFSASTDTAPQGVPIGLELMGRVGQDEWLLGLAERFEGLVQGRKAPLDEVYGGM